ncbi:hypothetical protein [Motilimonas pumila]|nr:hypothetical protein [Motilimonas pumila]
MNRTIRTTCTSLLLVILSACQDSGGSNAIKPSKPTAPTTKPTGSSLVTPAQAPNTELTQAIDKDFLKQLRQAKDFFKQSQIWPSYQYGQTSQLYVRVDGNNEPQTAIMLNPQSHLKQGQQIGANENYGLTALHLEHEMHQANDKLRASNGGNDTFEFYYSVDGHNYYLQRYKPSSVNVTHPDFTADIALAVHEIFHNHQAAEFKTSPHTQQLPFEQLNQYPNSLQFRTLQLAQLAILQGLPDKTMTAEEAKKQLQEYWLMAHEQIKLEQAATGKTKQQTWVYRHGMSQERYEGSAQYIDVMLSRAILPVYAKHKFISFDPLQMDNEQGGYSRFNNAEQSTQYFAFNIFYDTGSSAIWLLNQAGFDLANIEQGETPYDMVGRLLPMSPDEQQTLLQELQSSTHWQAVAAAAARYQQL